MAENLKYPLKARIEGIEGKVYVQFIVNEKGRVTEIKTVKGIGGGCDQEAERVVALAQPFTPGMQKGVAVKVRMVLPIFFELSGSIMISNSNLAEPVFFTLLDKAPTFPGGQKGFSSFLEKEFNSSPDMQWENKRTDIVLHFIVERDGNLSDFRFIRGSTLKIERAVIAFLENAPLFSAGIVESKTSEQAHEV